MSTLKLALIAFIVNLILISSASAGAGYTTGNDYKKMDINTKATYITGALDMLFTLNEWESIVGHNKIEKCSVSMPLRQLIAVIDKYVDEHPEEWHYRMSAIAFRALEATCRKL